MDKPQWLTISGGILVLQCLGSGSCIHEAREGVTHHPLVPLPCFGPDLCARGEGDTKARATTWAATMGTFPDKASLDALAAGCLEISNQPEQPLEVLLNTSLKNQLQIHTFPKLDLFKNTLWNLVISFYKLKGENL